MERWSHEAASTIQLLWFGHVAQLGYVTACDRQGETWEAEQQAFGWWKHHFLCPPPPSRSHSPAEWTGSSCSALRRSLMPHRRELSPKRESSKSVRDYKTRKDKIFFFVEKLYNINSSTTPRNIFLHKSEISPCNGKSGYNKRKAK